MRTQKIGVFISHIFGDYQSMLSQGIIDKATEYGYDVDIFCSTDGENLGEYGIGEKSILRIPSLDEYAGIIFASSTYLLGELREQITQVLLNKCHCPIVEVGTDTSPFSKVLLDNHSPIGLIVEHLICTHHYKNIAYLGNTLEPYFSDYRFEIYKNSLIKNNANFDETLHIDCTYDDVEIDSAIETLLSHTPRPEAIICYNDKMAMSAMLAIQKRKLQIPDDIAITGCDNLDIGKENTPILTSVTFPAYEVGTTAVSQIIAQIDGETLDTPTVTAKPFIGTSCGCTSTTDMPPLLYVNKQVKQIETLEHSLVENIHMSANLQGISDIDEGMDMLQNFVSTLPGCKEFYLCLYSDWNHVSKHIRKLTLMVDDDVDNNSISLKFAMKDGRRMPECTFSKRSTLPDYISNDSSSVFIYSPLFFGEKEFGYLAIAYENNIIRYPFTFITWIMNINAMLKGIRDKRNMGLLINRLEDIYAKDDLTGLYNRQGFNLVCKNYLAQAEENMKSLFVAIFDLDGLKIINDRFGHLEGNFAIQVLGHALENSVGENDICARLGGDEFYVLGTDYTEEEATLLLNRVSKYLDNYNKLNSKEYNICASGGFYITDEFVSTDLQELYDNADKQMYEEKCRKEKHILKSEKTAE